jgi:Na+/H+-dicarboxylate symporter
MKKFPLHIRILAALVLGAFFGSFFSVSTNILIIKYKSNQSENKLILKDWNEFSYILSDTLTKKFNSKDQNSIIKYFEKNFKDKSVNISYKTKDDEKLLSNVISISKEVTPATVIRPIGDIFIRLLSFLAIPLVVASLIVGAASLGDIKKLGRIGLKTFIIFMATTAIAIIIGLIVADIIRPGDKLSDSVKSQLISSTQTLNPANDAMKNVDFSLTDFVVEIVPKNPFNALTTGNMLQIVFFSVFFGISITFIPIPKRDLLIEVFGAASDTLIKMVGFVMLLAPFGVFALISSTVADFGFDIIATLIWYIFAVLLGLLLHAILVYMPLVKFLGKYPIRKFYSGLRNAIAIAFSTSSSAATLPVTMDCCERNLGVPKNISGFVLPLGATINMDGTALYQGVAAVFIAQVYGIDLGLTEQLTIVFTAVLASIGTAPVPGVGIIMLVMILQAVHIPPEGIALIIGVDRLLDMARTINNITGDSAVALAVATGERNRK